MRRTVWTTPLLAASLALLSAVPSFGAGDPCGSGSQLEIIGLTLDQRLICFPERAPQNADPIGFVTGLGGSAGDTRLVGIDFRVSNGALYGVGDAGGIYTIDPRNASATFRAQLGVALSGTQFGVDVNPAADALRIVSDTGQNLRFSFAAGTTTADTALSYPPAAPSAAGITSAAYTNNDKSALTATTLFVLDAALDQVVVQAPANSGTLSATGKLGFDLPAGGNGFDVYSTLRGGVTVSSQGYLSTNSDGRGRFYQVSLLTGRAALRGNFKRQDTVIDIAVPLNQRSIGGE